ncbi:hypothetical protein BD414DRAFT_174088 [Trametes punicea]|nr:hypothetical protein BD414DRAFT_174088 [Trametes punicea]
MRHAQGASVENRVYGCLSSYAQLRQGPYHIRFALLQCDTATATWVFCTSLSPAVTAAVALALGSRTPSGACDTRVLSHTGSAPRISCSSLAGSINVSWGYRPPRSGSPGGMLSNTLPSHKRPQRTLTMGWSALAHEHTSCTHAGRRWGPAPNSPALTSVTGDMERTLVLRTRQAGEAKDRQRQPSSRRLRIDRTGQTGFS